MNESKDDDTVEPNDGALSRQQSDFLAMIVHDLKNPLGAVFGYTDVLLDTAAGEGLTREQRDIVSRIRTTSLRCIDLVRNYQLLAYLSTAAHPKLAAKNDLNTIVDLVLQSLWRDASRSPRIVLEKEAAEVLVQGEKSLLDRIIANLVSNALKFAPADGVVTITTRRRGTDAILEVHNTGSSIPDAERGKIFERFYRGHNSIGTSGSGLGLHIVKRICDLMGANISIESAAERGTLFRVTFHQAPE